MAIGDNKDKQRVTGNIGGAGNTAGQGALQGGGNNAPKTSVFTKKNIDTKTGKAKKVPAPIGGNGVPRYKAASDSLNGPGVNYGVSNGQVFSKKTGEAVGIDPSPPILDQIRSIGSEVRISPTGLGQSKQEQVDRYQSHIQNTPMQVGESTSSTVPQDEKLLGRDSLTSGSMGDKTIYRSQGPSGESVFSDKNLPRSIEYNPFERGGAGLSVMNGKDRNGETSGRLGDGLAAMQELTQAYRDFNNPEITGTKGLSQDAYLAAQNKQKERDNLISKLSAPGKRTRFGTATTVGGKQGSAANIIKAFAAQDAVDASTIANAERAQLGRDQIAANAQSDLVSQDTAAGVASIAARKADAAERKSQFDQVIDQQRLGLDQEKAATTANKNVMDVYSKAAQGQLSKRDAIYNDASVNGIGAAMKRNPEIMQWVREQNLGDMTPQQQFNAFIKGNK